MPARPGPGGHRRRGSVAALPWMVAGLAGLGLVLVLLTGRSAGPVHPEPRADAVQAGAGVMPASFFAGNPRVMEAYRMAREIPATLDGLYCYCQCKENLGHRSLLICFHSQHGAGCDVCIGQAELAHRMIQEGRSLADIRTATDLAYGR